MFGKSKSNMADGGHFENYVFNNLAQGVVCCMFYRVFLAGKFIFNDSFLTWLPWCVLIFKSNMEVAPNFEIALSTVSPSAPCDLWFQGIFWDEEAIWRLHLVLAPRFKMTAIWKNSFRVDVFHIINGVFLILMHISFKWISNYDDDNNNNIWNY